MSRGVTKNVMPLQKGRRKTKNKRKDKVYRVFNVNQKTNTFMCFTKWITKEKCSLLKTWQSEFLQQERLLQKFIHIHFGNKKGRDISLIKGDERNAK